MIDRDHRIFYDSYPADYHFYKGATLESMLKNLPKFDEEYLSEIIENADHSRYERFLKSEVRMTFFHAIETVFELLFALEPTGSTLHDKDLWMAMLNSKFARNNERIRHIANSESNLDFLDQQSELFENRPFWMYVFYFQTPFEEGALNYEELQESRIWIGKFLRVIAMIYSKRNEYNAYKHGLRILNTVSDLSFSTEYSQDSGYVEDLRNSMSVLSIEKIAGKPAYEVVDVIEFTTEEDIEAIKVCSLLIQNIIRTRRDYFFKEKSTQALVFTKSDIEPVIQGLSRSGESILQFKNPL